jgi:hypothetical protein
MPVADGHRNGGHQVRPNSTRRWATRPGLHSTGRAHSDFPAVPQVLVAWQASGSADSIPSPLHGRPSVAFHHSPSLSEGSFSIPRCIHRRWSEDAGLQTATGMKGILERRIARWHGRKVRSAAPVCIRGAARHRSSCTVCRDQASDRARGIIESNTE